MPAFKYTAIDDQGKEVTGDVDAGTKQDAINKVHDMGYVPTEVEKKSSSGGSVQEQAAQEKQEKKKSGFTFGRVSQGDLTRFTSQLAVLMDAGLPIVRSLKILEDQMQSSTLKNITATVADDVETGSSLSEAMAKHPKAFDRLYVNMIKAGEAGGVLDTILNRLSEFMEKAEALKRKIISAAIYPIAVLSFAVLIVFGIMYFIVPQFVEVFEDMGASLPMPTKFLIGASEFIASVQGMITIVLIPVMFALVYFGLKSFHEGRKFLARVKLNMPLFGNIVRKAVTARFCRTFGTLTSSGVPILDALGIVRGAIGNEVVTESVQKVHDSIREGESIAEPLSQTGVFDEIVVNMIAVGEETGELDKMLMKIADTYEDEVDAAVEGLTSLIEPILIITLGVVIGGIVVALFMPLVDLIQHLQ